jgi:hypothetical protein
MCEECKVPKYQVADRFREAIEDYVTGLTNVEIPQYVEIEYVSSEPSTSWGYKYFVKQIYASGRVDFDQYYEMDLDFNFIKFEKQLNEVAE